jgi:hypothetical protein
LDEQKDRRRRIKGEGEKQTKIEREGEKERNKKGEKK